MKTPQSDSTAPKTTKGIAVLALLTIEGRTFHEHPAAVKDWIIASTNTRCGESTGESAEFFSAGHPALGCVAGYAFATLERGEGEIRLQDVRVSVGDEIEALRDLNGALRRHEGTVAHYEEGRLKLQQLIARMMLCDVRIEFDANMVSKTAIDVSYVVSPYPGYPTLPLALAHESLGLGTVPQPRSLKDLGDAYRRGDRVTLANEALERLEMVAALYVRVFAGRDIHVARLPYGGEILGV